MIVLVDVGHAFHKSFSVFKKMKSDFNLSLQEDRKMLFKKVSIDLNYCISDVIGLENFALCFDSRSWRKDFYKDYKSNRTEKEDGLSESIEEFYQLTKNFGINSFKSDGLESDDLIALMKQQYSDSSKLILSADADMHQLIDKKTSVFTNNSKNRVIYCHPGDFRQYFMSIKYKKEEKLAKYELIEKIVLGCSSDNIPKLLEKGLGGKYVEMIFSNNQEKPINDFHKFFGIGRGVNEKNFLMNKKLVHLSSEEIPQELRPKNLTLKETDVKILKNFL